ncbi:ATP-binding protein [Streptomyces sp. NPDC058157]|uniref:ATP-binding protein n=1 Tax=Streptomyces sp. NPDC058157 TaxID=3346360 RepID=UPI0036EDCCD4
MYLSGHWRFPLGHDGGRALEPGMSCVRGVLDALPGEGDGAAAARLREDVLLVACELLANACRHTAGPTRLDIHLSGGRITVAVTDRAVAAPVLRPWRPREPHGHGLHVVDRLAVDWGVRPAPGGKTVWATLPAPWPSPGPGRAGRAPEGDSGPGCG